MREEDGCPPPKNTRFFINNYFKSNADAFVLIKALHEAGFLKLYLLTGQVFEPGELPEHLTAILKSDIDEIVRFAGEVLQITSILPNKNLIY